jgi:putative flippase GtrA
VTLQTEQIPARAALTRQIPAFAAIGGLGFCVDAGLTVLITACFGLSPFLARLPAVVAATIATFLLNRAFTFDGRGFWLHEFGRYIVVAASGQLVNYAVYAAVLTAIERLGLGLAPALIAFAVGCGAGAAMFLTFLGFRFFAFRS